MKLQMIRYGMVAGFSFLLTLAILEWLACRPAPVAAPSGEGDIAAQVWQVLAEARRIVEESA